MDRKQIGTEKISDNFCPKFSVVDLTKSECKIKGDLPDKLTNPSCSKITGNLTPLLRCSISDVDDAFLTTFVNTPKTPKSGAAGYGLGMDFEDLVAGSSIDLYVPTYFFVIIFIQLFYTIE